MAKSNAGRKALPEGKRRTGFLAVHLLPRELDSIKRAAEREPVSSWARRVLVAAAKL